MNKGIISIIVTAASLASFVATAQPAKPEAQGQSSRAKPAPRAGKESAKPEAPAQPAAPVPTGPTGIGNLKLGMTKDAVSSLGADELVRLDSPLTAKTNDTAQPAGVERFDAKLAIRLSGNETVNAVFTFREGVLTGLALNTMEDSDLLERLARKIEERYGPAKVEDNRKEEPCIYRNGNSFTLKNGMVTTQWSTATEDGKLVSTSLTEISTGVCPPSLAHGSILALKIKSLFIRYVSKEQEPKKSLF